MGPWRGVGGRTAMLRPSTQPLRLAASAGDSSPLGSSSASASDPVATAATDTAPSEDPTSALPGTLVWEAGDQFRLTDTALGTTRLFARPAEGAQLVAVADFDADGQS